MITTPNIKNQEIKKIEPNQGSDSMREDWIECTLDKLIDDDGLFKDGDWVEKKDQDPNGQVRLIQLADIGDGNFRDKSSKYLNLKRAKEMNCSFLMQGDILIARMPEPLGRCTFFPFDEEEKFITAVDVAILRPKNKSIYNSFLLHQINSPSIRNKIDKLKSGTTRKRISRKNLNKINFSFPSLVEQKAIVKKIEELFSSLDSGIADLKKAQDQLVIYRQAVLKKAFEGEWKSTTVGELFDFVGGGTPSKREKEYWNGNIPWASVKDIKGDYLLKTQDFITEKGLNNSSANIALKGEIILITRISPGKSLITTIDTAVNQDLKVVKPKVEMYNKYIHYLFKSIERVCIKLSSGTTVKGINLPNLKSIEIPIIEPVEQHQIVQEIESRLSVCDKVEKDIADSLEKAQALRQSILKKAFEGTLLSAAEIKECKEHKEYEPASVLLERIREEKKKK
ncbi:restriction endonuclease subunit S [Bizionia sp. M204]|uniref:restriction endonuclease subunit S n=1 Tax=Bizionia sp. M204 TaxID=2675331 RepID=UPI002059F4DA|nr:restriction endonuclease subunit S [Bizionia sp. M204]UPS90731.1 restriction endonuclease subunit S [Bizionia sp. M204]